MMRIHVLGVCGTFMGGLALIARELGHEVSGSDAGVYPPMSTMLAEAGIPLTEGWAPESLPGGVDLFIIGNSLSRGNPAVEHVLNERRPYTSGPQWLAEQVLHRRRVLAIAGTHGKTTTTAMLAWLLAEAGLEPGYLIGGLPPGFGSSGRLGNGDQFVIEADEYDTAFFDKRSKFVHYRPEVLLINNLEFDHADIFADLAAIERQFHHCVRTVPGRGLILAGAHSPAVDAVLAMGCWSAVQRIGAGAEWELQALVDDYSAFRILRDGACFAEVEYGLFGPHNAANACAAAAIGAHLGLDGRTFSAAMASFQAPKRRLELLATPAGVPVYDDFAHHPTAVALSLASLAARHPGARLVAVLEPRSNTMRMGVHRASLAAALAPAGLVFIHEPPGLGWDIRAAVAPLGERARVEPDIQDLAAGVAAACRDGDVVVVMSNGAFGGIHGRIIELLGRQSPHTGSFAQ